MRELTREEYDAVACPAAGGEASGHGGFFGTWNLPSVTWHSQSWNTYAGGSLVNSGTHYWATFSSGSGGGGSYSGGGGYGSSGGSAGGATDAQFNNPDGVYDPSPDDGIFGLEVIPNEDGSFTWQPEVRGFFDLEPNGEMDDGEGPIELGDPRTTENGWETRDEVWDWLSTFTPLTSDAFVSNINPVVENSSLNPRYGEV